MIEQQKEVKNAVLDGMLTARQLYHHDLLLMVLKDKCHLNTLGLCVGSILLPGVVFFFWWLAWIHTTTIWNVGNTLSVLLQTFILFPVIFLIYQLIPISIAELFNTFRMNGVIGSPRKDASDNQTYEIFERQMVLWIDNSGWTLAILLLVICYALYRLLLLEPVSSSPVPYWMRVCAIVSLSTLNVCYWHQRYTPFIGSHFY